MQFLLTSKLKFIKQFCNRNISSTIFAVSSGHGRCGVAVLRVSGPHAGVALQSLTSMKTLPNPRHAILKYIKSPKTGEVLDKGIVIWFPGPKSFTGEDSCEFQIHGGNAVITGVLNALSSLDNFRLAEPGEFTKRAFYNKKLDLTEVEGLSDLLAAETEAQRKQAFLQAHGSLSKVYDNWKDILVSCLANLEAHIDFEETEELEGDLFPKVTEAIQKLKTDIALHLADGRKGERLRNGVRTIILGAPNVGKSSLLNALCQRPAAIVTPIEGTTRDALEVMLDINGYPLVLIDTAGLRTNTNDIVELEGIQRTLNALESADLVLLIIDCISYLTWHKKNDQSSFVDYLKKYIHKLNVSSLLNNQDSQNIFIKPVIPVINKCDLIDIKTQKGLQDIEDASLISCVQENGFTSLTQKMTDQLKILCGDPSSEHPNMNQMRHRQNLILCLKYLNKFLYFIDNTTDTVLMVEELRKAVRQIGKITGAVTTEQLLDIIFKEFCIGK